MTHGNDDREGLGSSSPVRNADASLNKENYRSPQVTAVSPSNKRTGSPGTQDDNDDHSLLDLTNLHITKPKTTEDDVEQPQEARKDAQEAGASREMGQGQSSHGEGADEFFYHEHKAVTQYFFDNTSVALELQELRKKVTVICHPGTTMKLSSL